MTNDRRAVVDTVDFMSGRPTRRWGHTWMADRLRSLDEDQLRLDRTVMRSPGLIRKRHWRRPERWAYTYPQSEGGER